jgi:hypothetical protein
VPVSMIQLLELGSVPEEPVKSSDHCNVNPEIDGTVAVITGASMRILLDKKLVARIVRRVEGKEERVSCGY